MDVQKKELPRKYHHAVEHWCRHNFPDAEHIPDDYRTYFAKDEPFCLCAKYDTGCDDEVKCGERAGEKKYITVSEMDAEQADRLFTIIRAQASTEFGSIQQHQITLHRSQDDENAAWVRRVMIEELRHGYQMIHLLADDAWEDKTGHKVDEAVEEMLSMETGSHVLGAFNIEYDSFVDNIVFACFIDRVGKYQLTMQRVCAYKPMAASMGPMLQEEAFHMAAGVIPLRRWVRAAAQGDGFVSMECIQRHFNKWIPRGLEMFGDERGGQTNVQYGFKDLANREALEAYYQEIQGIVDELNLQYLAVKLPDKRKLERKEVLERLKAGEVAGGVKPEEILFLPNLGYFRSRGEHAFRMVDVHGREVAGLDEYRRHLVETLPEAYLAHRDFKFYWDRLSEVARAETTAEEASKRMPELKRVGFCPCSKSVRWVMEATEEPKAEESASPKGDAVPNAVPNRGASAAR